MVTLAVDTSGPVGTVALRGPDGLVIERTLNVGSRHGQSLVTEVARLCVECGLALAECRLTAVVVGPGSFTGLRVGVVFAKTLAYATGCQVAAINALHGIAHNAPPDVDRVEVTCDAQRSELFVETFVREKNGSWDSVAAVRIVNKSQWVSKLDGQAVVMGPGLSGLVDTVSERCRVLPPETWRVQGPRLIEMGELAARRGLLADPWSLEPLYLRKSSAEEKWEARERTIVAGRGSCVPQAAKRL